MRFLIKRILKNFPSIYKHWLAFINYIDFKHYDKYCSDYKIIPMGDNCIPRVISTINRLKPTKKYGEKSYPFDLCFSDFYFNTLFIDSNFNNFFENIEFDPTKKYYVNKKIIIISTTTLCLSKNLNHATLKELIICIMLWLIQLNIFTS